MLKYFYIILLFSYTSAKAQTSDEFNSAAKIIEHYQLYWKPYINKGMDTKFASAIVFPELLRYDRLRNRMEVIALEVLYINFGTDYADFSVGPFQMKPSFAEKIESECGINCADRRSRVEKLNSVEGQLEYLYYFIKLMDKKYSNRKWNSAEEKLKFYATAYNCGYWQPEKYIRSMMSRELFRLDELSTEKYNYGKIAWQYAKGSRQ